jgi:hypothetical protein
MKIIILVIIGVILLACTAVAIVFIVKSYKNKSNPPLPDDCLLTKLCQHGTPDSGCQYCVCDSGWTGQYCDVVPTPPPPNCQLTKLCQHGSPDAGCAVCVCDNGWTGQYCSDPVTPPPPNCPLTKLCQHGIPDSDCQRCMCDSGWSGSYCSEQACPCVVGHGTCSDTSDPTKCVCLAGFKGVDCSESDKPCPNGCSQNGVCDDGTCVCDMSKCKNGVMNADCSKCVCNAGWSGSDCGTQSACMSHLNYPICMTGKNWRLVDGNTSHNITLTDTSEGLSVNIDNIGYAGTVTFGASNGSATWNTTKNTIATTHSADSSVIAWVYPDGSADTWTSV